MRKCTNCNNLLDESEFDINPRTGDYYRKCRKCHAKNLQYMKTYYQKNKDRIRQYQNEHKDEIAKYNHDYGIAYREKYWNVLKERRLQIDLSPASYATYAHRFCEEVDMDAKGNLLVRCKYCNRFFTPIVRDVRHYLEYDNGIMNLYCSKACKTSCPTYRAKKYERGYKKNTSREVQPELRKMVLERDNWTCQKCGKSKEANSNLILHCHHIEPVKTNPIESADIDNCVTLCKDCHKEVHTAIKGCSYYELAKCQKKEVTNESQRYDGNTQNYG